MRILLPDFGKEEPPEEKCVQWENSYKKLDPKLLARRKAGTQIRGKAFWCLLK